MDSYSYPVLERKVEYETGWFDAGFDHVQQPNETTKKYYWADLNPSVSVVAHLEGELVMVRQYRPVIEEYCLEVPTGMVEEGESPEEAAVRELAEETGYRPGSTELLTTTHVANGVLRHQRSVVYATDLEPGEQSLDENEFLEVLEMPVEDALEAAREPPVVGGTLNALLVAQSDGILD